MACLFKNLLQIMPYPPLCITQETLQIWLSLSVSNANTELWVKMVTTDRNYIFNQCFRKVISLTVIILPFKDGIKMKLEYDIFSKS